MASCHTLTPKNVISFSMDVVGDLHSHLPMFRTWKYYSIFFWGPWGFYEPRGGPINSTDFTALNP